MKTMILCILSSVAWSQTPKSSEAEFAKRFKKVENRLKSYRRFKENQKKFNSQRLLGTAKIKKIRKKRVEKRKLSLEKYKKSKKVTRPSEASYLRKQELYLKKRQKVQIKYAKRKKQVRELKAHLPQFPEKEALGIE